MTVELIESPEELNPGDIVIYPSMGNLLTAQIEQKPVLRKQSSTWYNRTKCKVPTLTETVTSQKWENGIRVLYHVPLEYQIFGFEKFEKVKYINFTNKRILRVVK
jgi:hypothetical protein